MLSFWMESPLPLLNATLYGGSVTIRFAFFPSMSAATSSALVASPHISLCLPTVQISPFSTNAAFSNAAERSKSSSFTSFSPSPEKRSAISSSPKPVKDTSKSAPCKLSISMRSSSSSHPASRAMRLSARM